MLYLKLQNFTVLFVIIVLPIIFVTSYYISLQISTSNMQTEYNQKILNGEDILDPKNIR